MEIWQQIYIYIVTLLAYVIVAASIAWEYIGKWKAQWHEAIR